METGVNYLVYSSVLQHISNPASAQSRVAKPHLDAVDHNDASGKSSQSYARDTSDARENLEQDLSGTISATDRHHHEASLENVAIAAAASGFALSFVLSPTELVKCRMQVRAALSAALSIDASWGFEYCRYPSFSARPQTITPHHNYHTYRNGACLS